MAVRITKGVSIDTVARMMNKAMECKKAGRVVTLQALEEAATDYSNFRKAFTSLCGILKLPKHYQLRDAAKQRAAKDFLDALNVLKNSSDRNKQEDGIKVEFHDDHEQKVPVTIEVNNGRIYLKTDDQSVSNGKYSFAKNKTINDFELYKPGVNAKFIFEDCGTFVRSQDNPDYSPQRKIGKKSSEHKPVTTQKTKCRLVNYSDKVVREEIKNEAQNPSKKSRAKNRSNKNLGSHK